MPNITIEAADGTGRQKVINDSNWNGWPIAKDAAGRIIPGHRMWGKTPAFNVAETQYVPKPMVVERRPIIVPDEVKAKTDPNGEPVVTDVEEVKPDVTQAEAHPVPPVVAAPKRGRPKVVKG